MVQKYHDTASLFSKKGNAVLAIIINFLLISVVCGFVFKGLKGKSYKVYMCKFENVACGAG